MEHLGFLADALAEAGMADASDKEGGELADASDKEGEELAVVVG